MAAFREASGHPPGGVWMSPGRVNLIGDHTDYNEGLALPAAIDRFAVVAAGLRHDGRVRCLSLQRPSEVAIALDDIAPAGALGWAAPLLGVVWALRRTGVAIPGVDLVVDSEIPLGGGLASSAALEVATVLALTELTGQPLTVDDMARCCQQGESTIAGAPIGVMDQLAVLAGRAGHAVFLDCRSLDRELIAFQPDSAGSALLVIDTGVVHSTGGAGYRARREQAADAASALGVHSLRDATLDAVDLGLHGVLRRRARHVLTENDRVRRCVELLRHDDVPASGGLLEESHASLRDDHQVSSAELDVAVEAARAAGAWGARMTGAGFGGRAIALVPDDACTAVAEAVGAAFARHRYGVPRVFTVATADGARRCD